LSISITRKVAVNRASHRSRAKTHRPPLPPSPKTSGWSTRPPVLFISRLCPSRFCLGNRFNASDLLPQVTKRRPREVRPSFIFLSAPIRVIGGQALRRVPSVYYISLRVPSWINVLVLFLCLLAAATLAPHDRVHRPRGVLDQHLRVELV
jgi:hypothetical protein